MSTVVRTSSRTADPVTGSGGVPPPAFALRGRDAPAPSAGAQIA